MICGICDKNDGMIYTSIPVQYRCTVTGEYHFGNHQCNCGGQEDGLCIEKIPERKMGRPEIGYGKNSRRI